MDRGWRVRIKGSIVSGMAVCIHIVEASQIQTKDQWKLHGKQTTTSKKRNTKTNSYPCRNTTEIQPADLVCKEGSSRFHGLVHHAIERKDMGS